MAVKNYGSLCALPGCKFGHCMRWKLQQQPFSTLASCMSDIQIAIAVSRISHRFNYNLEKLRNSNNKHAFEDPFACQICGKIEIDRSRPWLTDHNMLRTDHRCIEVQKRSNGWGFCFNGNDELPQPLLNKDERCEHFHTSTSTAFSALTYGR